MLIHASTIALNCRGLLILGPSGAGKSGLALRLMASGARLVADDQTHLEKGKTGELIARAPSSIAGRIEARQVGLIRVEPQESVELALAVDLGRSAGARLPQSETIELLDVRLELICGRNVPNIEAVLTILLQNGRKLPL